MNGNRKPHIFVLRAAAVLLVLVLLTTSVVSERYARYVSTASGGDRARIAAYVFDVNDTEGHIIDLTEIRKPGDNKSFQFTVDNYRNDVVSEVAEKYVLTIELQSSLPLTCTLTGGNETIMLTGVGGTGSATNSFEAAVQSDEAYTLRVDWDKNENGTDIEYSRAGIAVVVLTVNAQQVD